MTESLLDHLALREGALDLTEHGVERETEAADLGALVRRFDPAAEAARGDGACGGAHALEWAHAPADQQPGRDEHKEGDAAADADLEEEQRAQRVVDSVDTVERDGDHRLRAGYRRVLQRREVHAV